MQRGCQPIHDTHPDNLWRNSDAISTPTAEAGCRAAEMLLAQINDEPLPETRVVLPTLLTVRESCGGQPLDALWRNSAALTRWTSLRRKTGDQ